METLESVSSGGGNPKGGHGKTNLPANMGYSTVIPSSSVNKKRTLKSILDYMAYLYYFYHSPKWAISLLTKSILITVTTPFVHYFEKYIFNEWEIAAALFVIVAWDIAWVIVKNLRSRIKWSWMEIILCGVIAMGVLTFLSVLHLYTNFATKPDYAAVQWGKSLIYACILTVYSAKISKNMSEATNGYFPPAWMMKRINNFNESGKISDLQNEKKD